MPAYLLETGQRILFVHVPKAAGTTVEATLQAHGDQFLYDPRFHGRKDGLLPVSAQHFHTGYLTRLFPAGFFDYSFLVVREPVARFVSEYKFRQGMKPATRRATTPLPETDPEGFDDWVDYAFEAFAADPCAFDNHLRPQVDFVFDGAEAFRLEDGLDPLWARLNGVTGLRFAPPPRRKQVSKDFPVSVSLQQQARIRDFYAHDYDAFGYD